MMPQTSEKNKPAEDSKGQNDQAVTHAADAADKIDDRVQSVADPGEKIFSFYTTNSSAIDAAAKGLACTTAYVFAQRTARDVLYPVEKVLDGLQTLSQIHPFVQVGFVVLKSIINIELARRQNDRRTVGLILQMGEMMGTLLQLKDFPNSEFQTDTGETVVGRLEALMPFIKDDLEECGRAIDAYRKQHLMVKFVKAPMYADLLISLGNGLADRKAQIVYALHIHTAVSVGKIQAFMEEMKSNLYNVVKSKSPEELEWEKELAALGGWEKCRSDPLKRDQLFKLFQAKFRGSSDTSDVGAEVAQGSGKGEGRTGLNALQNHALDASIDELIEENAPSYSQKLNQQMDQIAAVVEGLSLKILTRLEAGPHERVKHPVVRRVWEESKWRTSVKATHFIRDLKDFYVDQVFKGNVSTPLVSESIAVSLESDDRQSLSPSSIELQHDPEFDWCLDHLTIFNLPHIMEAFDDDSSGWIKIQEVNDFTDSIPTTWNLLQWMAYWAAGWQFEISRYRTRIHHILSKMINMQNKVLQENNEPVNEYLDDWWIRWMAVLVDAAGERMPPSDKLIGLVETNMATLEAKWTALLEANKFGIDSVDSLVQLSAGHRVESFVFPLLYILLRHHYRIMQLAQTMILSDKELHFASLSISCVMQAVFRRRMTLEEEFRQRHMDAAEQFKYFSGGLFSRLNFKNTQPQVQYIAILDSYSEQEEAVLTRIPDLTVTELKFQASALDISGYRERQKEPNSDFSILPPLTRFRRVVEAVCPNVLRWSWTSMRRRRSSRQEFMQLALKIHRSLDIRRHHENKDDVLVSPNYDPLTVEENLRFDEIYRGLDLADVKYYRSLVSLFFRRSQRHLGIHCDGCGVLPITGVRFKCVQCDDFDYCTECEANSTFVNFSGNQGHEVDHDMLQVSWALPRVGVHLSKVKAEKTLGEMRQTFSQSTTDGSGLFAIGEDTQNEEFRYNDASYLRSIPEENGDDVIGLPHGNPSAVRSQDGEGHNVIGTAYAVNNVSLQTDDTVKYADNAWKSGPPQRLGRFICNGGCGRSYLSGIFYVCLDCSEGLILCGDCHDMTITTDITKGSSSFTPMQCGNDSIHNSKDAEDSKAGLHHQAMYIHQTRHNPRHVFLKVKRLNRDFGSKADFGEPEDATRLILRLERDLVPRIVTLDDRIRGIATTVAATVTRRVADVEDSITEIKCDMAEIKRLLRQLLGVDEPISGNHDHTAHVDDVRKRGYTIV